MRLKLLWVCPIMSIKALSLTGVVPSQKLGMMYNISLSHQVLYSVVMKASWLIHVTLIPLNDHVSALGILVSKMLVNAPALDVLIYGMFVQFSGKAKDVTPSVI